MGDYFSHRIKRVVGRTVLDTVEELIICEPSSLSTGCWEWPGALNKTGYGKVFVNGVCFLVHRLIYEHYVGPIPSHLECDHLCRNHACANFEHIELVDRRTNSLRGVGFAAINARKSECVNGHPFNEQNTYYRLDTGQRHCRACHRKNELERYHRTKSQL